MLLTEVLAESMLMLDLPEAEYVEKLFFSFWRLCALYSL